MDLILKSQDPNWPGYGAIKVIYLPPTNVVQVWTNTSNTWTQQGSDLAASFASGDQFGASATASGQVNIYKNGVLLGTRDITSWGYYASGGYIGLITSWASGRHYDDFGGGTRQSASLPDFGRDSLAVYRTRFDTYASLGEAQARVGRRLSAMILVNLMAPLAAVPPATQVWRSYYYQGATRIAMREVTSATNKVYYLLSDHLGSTSVVANADGSVYSEMRYKPWGETRYSSATNTPTQYRFTGQRASLDLYYYNARWMDPLLGRFIQADDVIPDPYNPQDWDRFSYVRNNAINKTDPTGNIPCEDTMYGCNAKKWQYRDPPRWDPDKLTDDGKVIAGAYIRTRDAAGWWNNYGQSYLSPEKFLSFFLLYEAAGSRAKILYWIKEVAGYQLFVQPPRPGFGGNSPYCSGQICHNGIFNFMAKYGGMGLSDDKYQNINMLRFSSISAQPPSGPRGETFDQKAMLAADVAQYIFVENKSRYRSGNADTAPYHWGNPNPNNPSYFTITDVYGNVIWDNSTESGY